MKFYVGLWEISVGRTFTGAFRIDHYGDCECASGRGDEMLG